LTPVAVHLKLAAMSSPHQPSPAAIPPPLRLRAPFRPAANATFGNPAFAAAAARVLILRLAPGRDVAASSPHLFLAQAVRRAFPAAFVDFAFLPPAEERRALRAANLPLAIGVQSRRGIAAFDLVLVSNSFLLEEINLPVLLLDAGLAPWADERPEAAPAVVLGGSNALASHALVRPDGAAVADVLFFGEGDDVLVPFLQAWHAAAGRTKRERLLQAASAADGFWVTGAWPDAKHPVRQAIAGAREAEPAGFPLLDGESADTVRLQAAFGCPAFCAFCFEGFERKPYREIPAGALLAQARRLKAASGARCVELDAYTLNSHADAAALVIRLARLFERVSLKSQRVDILAAQPALAALEVAAGKRSFTLGIEGISPRLRAFLNKGITDSEIDGVLQNLLARAVREIKLFYLITGHESAEDIATFGAFVRALGARVHGVRLGTRVVFSFGFLVRMPRTPLRHDRLFLDRAPLEKIADELERMCRRSQFEFRLAASWSEHLATQILAAADCRLAPVLVALAREGWLFDGTPCAEYARRLQEAMTAAGLWDEAFLGEKPATHRFPFHFVAGAVSPKFLWKQYELARRGRENGYCLGDTCLACGACRSAAARKTLTARPRVPEVPPEAAAEVERLTRDKQRLPLVFCRVRLGDAFAGASPEWASARLLQLLLAAMPDETENLLSADESLFAAPTNRERFPIAAGETVVALRAWDAARLTAALAQSRAAAAAGRGPRPPVAATGEGQVGEGDLTLGEVLPDFSHGAFSSSVWKLRVDGDAAAAEAAVTRWLKEMHLAFTLRRAAGGAVFELAPAALRKGIVLAAACAMADGCGVVSLTITAKADLLALLRLLPPLLEQGGMVCERVES
jgi:hypothetical protein